ncbi:DUF2497 domain-containing protein [Roseomonas sp. KE2513]|uniref:DUF2497 domain-containing protein n=1 Tax=Roseomonas sp. KE2513 TaxID=2479202 RepID=UPI001E3ED447|nr:DUF2497 domain-containing protein [Roseomonas sp. KE2513]
MSAATTPGQDPSMEDILASIRKILNEEEAAAPPAEVPAAPAPAPALAEEPLVLTEEMLVAPPPAPSAPGPARPALLEPESQSFPQPPAPAPLPEPAPAPPPMPPVPMPPPVQSAPAPPSDPSEGLVAPATAAAAAAILGQLARTVAAERSAPVHRAGPSIEDVVREELRPMLKAWMDAHLPALMERLVRAEIERVVSRSFG